jgi:hypothetical protein
MEAHATFALLIAGEVARMDLSKLPRLSKTAAPPPAAAEETPPAAIASTASQQTVPCPLCNAPLRPGARFCDTCGAQLVRNPQMNIGSGIAEGWLSIAIAALLLFLFPNFLRYLAHSQNMPTFTDADGNPLSYAQSAFIWSDIGVTLFCAVLLLDAAVMLFVRKRILLHLAFALSVLTALFNIGVIIHVTKLAGFPVQCAIAVAFAIYLAIVQRLMLREQS